MRHLIHLLIQQLNPRLALLLTCGLYCVGLTAAENRVALVIGNANYETNALANPVNDAEDISKVLEKMGFKVLLLRNGTQPQMETKIQEFGRSLHSDTVGLFYYSGHGVQHDGNNYLLPIGSVDQVTAPEHLRYKAVDSGYVMGVMKQAGNRLNIVILDACRSNPFKSFSRSMSRGLTRMAGVEGTLIAYSTSPGNVALDGTGRNSPYTRQLIDLMKQPELPIELVFKQVRQKVKEETNGEQTPWYEASIDGDFYFQPGTGSGNEVISPVVEVPPVKVMPVTPVTPVTPSIARQSSGNNLLTDFINTSVLVFYDNFNGEQDRGWVTDGQTYQIADGWYEIQGRDTDYNTTYLQITEMDWNRDFLIQTRLANLKGANNSGYGLIFGAEDAYNLYGLYLNGDGSFVYGAVDNNEWRSITEWTASRAINKGNADNKVAIQRIHDQLKFYINDQLVYEGPVPVFKGSSLGFTTSKPTLKVDYLNVRALQPVAISQVAETPAELAIPVTPVKTNKTYSLADYGNSGVLMFYDGFEREKGWVYDETYQLNSGWYEIKNREQDYNTVLQEIPNLEHQDNFLIQAKFHKLSGDNASGYGLLWGAKDSYNVFGLYLNGDGQFVYGELENNNWISHTEWMTHAAIKKSNSMNTVSILRTPQQLKFFINDKLIYEGEAAPLKGSQVGFTTSKPKIKIDYINVKKME